MYLFRILALLSMMIFSTQAVLCQPQQQSKKFVGADVSLTAEQNSQLAGPCASFYTLNDDLRRIGLAAIGDAASNPGLIRITADYKIGFNDNLLIKLSGKVSADYPVTVDMKGNIVLPGIGKIAVGDLKIEDARMAVKNEVDKKYANIDVELYVSDISDIPIMVIGHVVRPGMYLVSPFNRNISA